MNNDPNHSESSNIDEINIIDERPKIQEDNKYHTRGCHCAPLAEDETRSLQMCRCAKLATFDWTKGLVEDNDISKYNVIEVRFKNSRKDFFRISDFSETLSIGNIVVVEAATGHDVGVVTLAGAVAHLQYRKRQNVLPIEELRKVFRRANQNDINKWNSTIDLEKDAQIQARKIAKELGLLMKINDVEYQGDGSKATFFYTADDRVDFRQLIKVYAEVFRVRIEMRQIGARQEAMHLGGIGSCGRELCCVTFLSNFHTVSTHTARVQQLSLNPQKLAGQCGKLKCCLNYEYEMYQEAAKDFPDPEVPLFLRKGKAIWQKTDVFARTMYYAYVNEQSQLIGLPIEAVHEIIQLNQQKEFPEGLEKYAKQGKVVPNDEVEMFENVVGQDELTRFDKRSNTSRPRRQPFKKTESSSRERVERRTTSESDKRTDNPDFNKKQTEQPAAWVRKPVLKPKKDPDA